MRPSLKQFKGFLFDLDGVLVDSYDCWRNMLNDVLTQRGQKPLTLEKFDPMWGQGPEVDREMFFPDWSLSQLLEFYDKEFPRYTQFVKKEAGAPEILSSLKQKGKLVGVASNSTRAIIRNLLEAANLLEYFDVITGAEEVQQSKPAPDLILMTLRKLQLDVTLSCYIGDSVFDEQAAEAAGIFFIGYKRTGAVSIQNFRELMELL